MARIKITIPESFSFQTIIPVRITDVNYGGHVGNDSILSLIHEARMQFLKSFGFTEMEIGGTGIIMKDVAIEFKNELFYGDQVQVFVALKDIEKVSFDIYYKMLKTPGDQIVALAKTGMICYNYQKKKIVGVPEMVKDMLTI